MKNLELRETMDSIELRDQQRQRHEYPGRFNDKGFHRSSNFLFYIQKIVIIYILYLLENHGL